MSLDATLTRPQPVTTSRPPAQLFLSSQRRRAVLCLVLVLLTLAVYNPIVHNGFTNFDDNGYITANPHVRQGLTWETVKWAFISRDCANWHPLTWLSHALDYQLFKLNPAGHHYVTVLLHTLNAVLLFLLLESATGFTWPAFMVAALFALHPVNVESVAWAAERKNVLSMLFLLLAMHAYGWYVRRVSVQRYLAVAVLFALGLMAKPEIITLPFVLLLWDYWPLRRMQTANSFEGRLESSPPQSFSFLVLEKMPLLLLSAGSAVITIVAQKAGNTLRDAPAWVRFGNAAVAYVRYIGKAFWPVRLAAPYPHLGRLLPKWEIAASSILLLSITGLFLHWRNRRYLVVGWFWFLGTLVPVIGLVQVSTQAMADRYAYLPYIGLFMCVMFGVAEIARDRKISVVWLGVPAAAILFSLGLVTRHQIGYWHDSETLWRHALDVTEKNYFAHDALGHVLADEGRAPEAIAEFSAAEDLGAYSPEEMVRFGYYEQTHGHAREAIQQYRGALDNLPDSKSRSIALGLLGSAFNQIGDIPRAKMALAYALQQNPENSPALIDNGLLKEREGDFLSAAAQISLAMKIEPSDVGYLLLEQAWRRAGHPAEADEAHAHAQQMSRDLLQAQRSAEQMMALAGIENR